MFSANGSRLQGITKTAVAHMYKRALKHTVSQKYGDKEASLRQRGEML